MDCSNLPASSNADVDYDSDVTEVQCWELVGSANLRGADGSYLAALELAVHSLQTAGDLEDGNLRAGPPKALFQTEPRPTGNLSQPVPREASVLTTLDAVQDLHVSMGNGTTRVGAEYPPS